MSLLNIYKASAGSGKTYRLSLEFLKYVIQEPDKFANILAVTFTNKATAEMKTRIISNLYGIANDLSDAQDDIKGLISELQPIDSKYADRQFIVDQAKKALSLMLHHYSHFHIETIDSFFQTILRTLEKELGLGTHLNIELDTEPVLEEAAAALLDDISQNKTLYSWVQQYLYSKLEGESSWNITDEIANFGKSLFSEGFQAESEQLFNFLENSGALSDYQRALKDRREVLLKELKDHAGKFMKFCSDHAFTAELFYQKRKGLWSYFEKLASGAYSVEMNSFVKPFYETKDPLKLSKDKSVTCYLDDIHKILVDAEDCRGECCKEVNTIDLIDDNLFQIGLLHYLDKKLREINAENNQFMLSDTQVLLNKMIGDSDAPFIYEKIGAYLDHIMIDEFQDTSETQWRNFKPLISECASNEKDNLVVGDPKQSIYRFRNGKWELMGRLKGEMKEFKPREITLDTNWRSELNVVNFNNKVFTYLPDQYKMFEAVQNADGDHHPLLISMIEAYADAAQKCKKADKKSGYVKVRLFDSTDDGNYKEKTLRSLADSIKEMQKSGIKPDQMAILIRDNAMVPLIAEYFTKYKEECGEGYEYDLISEEAYQLDASDTIQAIISALRYIASLDAESSTEKQRKQKNRLATAQLLHSREKVLSNNRQAITPPNPDNLDNDQKEFIESIAKLQLYPLYEMVEGIYQIMGLKHLPNQENYYCFFLDRLNDFLVKHSSNLRLFLRSWDDYIHNMTIPSGESKGIRVMTIHKSKGLEFHTVFIPFCDWPIGFKTSNILWERTADLPELYRSLPFTAVKCCDKMANSYFQSAYVRELVETYMDNLNVLYVALTRSVKNLFVFGKKCGKIKDGVLIDESKMVYISHLLQKMFETDHCSLFDHSDPRRVLWDEMAKFESSQKLSDEFCYELGTLDSKSEPDKQTDNPFKQLPEKETFKIESHSQKGKFQQSNKSNDFILNTEQPINSSEFIDRGNLYHYVLSLLKSYEDVERVVEQVEFEGLIQNGEKPALIASLKKVMESPEGQKWFRPGLILFNECTILSRNKNGLVVENRPDRVILEGQHVTVIDFKFGKRNDDHKEQIENYADLLRKMGYEVESNIWYLNEYFS